MRKVKRLESKRSRGPLSTLGPAESKVARKVLSTGRRMGATRKEQLAAAETGLVESGFRNLGYGHADSEGWRQERAMYYPNPRNVKAAARRFFSESVSDTGGTRGVGMTAGQLAQTIQASANPGAYDARKPEAAAIVRDFNKGGLKPGERRQLKGLKARANKLGIQLPKSQMGRVPKKVMTRFKAGLAAAKELEKAKLPYVWGGGHGDPQSRPTGGGLDCSGAVSYVLNKMGVMKGSLVSGEMGSVLEPGPGAVTVFYNPVHTFMRIGNRYFGTSSTNPGGGAGFIEGKPDDLSKYNVGHVPGMGEKVATAMGLSAGRFPGMALSSSGTTATITEGATQGPPGFSLKPITPTQRARRTLRKLKKLGAGVQPAEETPEEELKNLHELERRHGRGAV